MAASLPMRFWETFLSISASESEVPTNKFIATAIKRLVTRLPLMANALLYYFPGAYHAYPTIAVVEVVLTFQTGKMITASTREVA